MHPKKDPWGKPLTKGLLAELAGQPLTKGHHRACIWSIQGDAEFYANVLKFPHWQNQYPCHECDAQRPVYKKGSLPWRKISEAGEGRSSSLCRCHPRAKRSSHPLFNIPGVTTAMVRGDSLHILYSRGVASHLAGSLLHYMCLYDYPKRQSVPASQRLKKKCQNQRFVFCKQSGCKVDQSQVVDAVWHTETTQELCLLRGKSSRDKAFFTLLGESDRRSSGPWGKPHSQHHAGVHPLLDPAHPAHR